MKLNYALYDGIPCISKWMEIENKSGMGITLDEFTLEQLAMAEPESPVEAKRPEQFLNRMSMSRATGRFSALPNGRPTARNSGISIHVIHHNVIIRCLLLACWR